MTFDISDLVNIVKSPVKYINSADGGETLVTGMRIVEISLIVRIAFWF